MILRANQAFICVLTICCSANLVAQEPLSAGKFIDLFDGSSLMGWDGDPRFWRVEDGVIVGQTTKQVTPQQNTFLIHRGGQFDDFELRLAYKVEGFNSGVQYRSEDQGNWVVSGYQCDFEDRWHAVKNKPSAAPTDSYSGMLFDEKERMFLAGRGESVIVRRNPANPKKPLIEKIGSVGDPVVLESHIKRDDWNELIVIANGNQLTHIINGHVMAMAIDEDTDNQRRSGVFAFQLHKGRPMKIQLKDIRVRRLTNRNSATSPAVVKPVAMRSEKNNDQYENYALQHSGNAVNGKRLFHDQRTKCVACHKIADKGGDVGKDLSFIGGKFGRAHLIESLLEPSRQIVEGYRTRAVLTDDGKTLTGIVKSENDNLLSLVDVDGKFHAIEKSSIEEVNVSDVSIMPSGIAQQLSLDEFTDLIAYLESLRSGAGKHGANVSGAISLPEGFVAEVVASGLDGLTALETLPDGRVLVCEQVGRVRIIENGELAQQPLLTLPVDSWWERGVIGVTHDPRFPKLPYIYVCWVAKDPHPHHRISRFTMKGNSIVEGSEKLLLVGDDQTTMGGKVPAGHQGGAVHFGPDGKLYIAIGEQTAGAPSQRLDTFLGKILRINSDGSIPTNNPFVARTKGKYQAIWAIGCRNPFTFAFRKTDGMMLINDVGGVSEEINVGRPGANYGWPTVEHGDQVEYQSDEFDGPIHWYPQSSLNGGDFCSDNSDWGSPWKNRFFFADFQHGWIKSIDPKEPREVKQFLSGIRQPVDLRFARDGSLYVLLRNAWVIDKKFSGDTGTVLRIRRDSKNSNAPKLVPSQLPSGQPAMREIPKGRVSLTRNAMDKSAGGLEAFKVQTPAGTYYLDKLGGGLSSLEDRDGNDWLGFHPKRGTGAGGEFRGFPNAVYKQGGSYFHAKNAHVDSMTTRVEKVQPDYVSIVAESPDGNWQGRYEFFSTHCSFTITKMPTGMNYWILYEGTPGGKLSADDWWMCSASQSKYPIGQRHEADIPQTEWMAFGDAGGKRSIVLLNHRDDDHPDWHYQMKNQMTVFGFGRKNLESYHRRAGKTFSIALVESTEHEAIAQFATRTMASQEAPDPAARPQSKRPVQ